MSLSRVLARPLLASIFIAGGVDAVRNPESKVESARKVTEPLSQRVQGLPQDTETLVKINGAVQVGAGLALATGKFRRLAALALIGSIVPTTLAGHRFWEETDEATKTQHLIHFLKNLGLLGGLILAAVDTEGSPSLGWRAKRQAKRASQAVALGGAVVGQSRGRASKKANKVVAQAADRPNEMAAQGASRANEVAAQAASRANEVAAQAAQKANQAAAKASAMANQIDFKKAVDQATNMARTAVERGTDVAGPLLHTGADRAGDLADRASVLLSRASDRLPVS